MEENVNVVQSGSVVVATCAFPAAAIACDIATGVALLGRLPQFSQRQILTIFQYRNAQLEEMVLLIKVYHIRAYSVLILYIIGILGTRGPT